jgi:hypothetical protein
VETWEAAYIAGVIDGEGSITLTRNHSKEMRRPCISISSNDKELLLYIKALAGGKIYKKKNYNPTKHQDSFTLIIKNKDEVFSLLNQIKKFLRIERKRKRAILILDKYECVTSRNGKYNEKQLLDKLNFEKSFFEI